MDSSIRCGPEPPMCVQNAMMTKDKKPFTYTPGGIDLSEIKSPRMAKRIARNAQFEGVSGQPKPSPLAQPNAAQQSPPAAPPPASALGMPVQVIPTGPPPPPPPQAGMPPPPPPVPQNQLKPQGTDTRKSPTPQNFEPPPLGCRPEIKIPPNPMASLKKVPKPKEKNDFWIEEYRKERSGSPMMTSSNEGSTATQANVPNSQPTDTYSQHQEQYQVPPQQQLPGTPKQYHPPSPPRQYRPPSPPRQNYDEPQPRQQPIPVQQPAPAQQYQQRQEVSSSQPSPRPVPPSNRWGPPVTPPSDQQQQQHMQQQSPRPQFSQQPIRNAQVGSLYIPPVAPENLVTNRQLQQQQSDIDRQVPVSSPPTPRWMAQKPALKEVPEWVREDPTPASSVPRAQQVQTPPSSSNTPQHSPAVVMSFQIAGNNPSAKERIVPIQMEPSTPTRTPGTPSFGPQPFYGATSAHSQTPSSAGSGQATPGTAGINQSNYGTRNPNQFVDQGYNNYAWPAQQRVTSPPVHQQQSPQLSGSTRIIPIAIEGRDGPFNPQAVRGPISQSPMVIQNDPRTLQHQNSWSNGAPNQSKSFKILQKITDTEQPSESDQPAQLQRPLYSRQLGSAVDGPTEQMKRMQLSDQDRDFLNRVKDTVDQEVFLHNVEDPRYRGASIPSKSFKALQNMIGIKPGDPQINQAPMHRPTQSPYTQQLTFSQADDPRQMYVHPSEQQVPEPKKYMGSAIPSRSFKILQAMTTPENAGPGQSDL